MGRFVLGSSRLSTARVFVFAPVEGLILEGVPADYFTGLLYSHYTSKTLKGGNPKQPQATSPTKTGRKDGPLSTKKEPPHKSSKTPASRK
jgi:pyocin large subunit-like protein